MLTQLEFKGEWYLPNNPNKKIAGTLYYLPNETIRLELIGGFYDNDNSVFDYSSTPVTTPVIHGVAYIDKKVTKITLLTCHKAVKRNSTCDFSLTKYFCQILLTGKLLYSIDEIIFNRIEVTFPCLNDWLPLPVIERAIKFNQITKKAEDFKWEIRKENVQEKSFSLDETTTITFRGSASFKNTEQNNGYILTNDTVCELTNSTKCSFSVLYSKMTLFKDFLSLATLSTIYYTSITLYDDDDYIDYGNSTIVHNPISLYLIEFNQVFKINNQYDYLFKFHDIEMIFPNIIDKWFSTNHNLAPIRTHLINSIAYKKEFTSLDFLIVIQAIEGYHRRFVNNNSRIYLSKRLEELYENFNDIKLITNNKVDIRKATASRNYYSHFYTKDGETNICEGFELFELTMNLKLLLICCTLDLIGFEKQEIDKLLCQNNKLIQRYSQ